MRLKEFAPSGDGGGSGDYFQALASAWYNGTFDSGSLQKGIKSQQDVEQLLQRGIIGPDGVTRKYAIDYNSTFDGVVISSDDYYEHADHDETDSRTGKPFGPYDYMEFGDEELDEATGDKKFDSMLSRMTAEPKYPDQDMPPTSIAELIQWADRNNKPYHEYFAQWARRNGFKNVNDALVWFGDNVDPSNPWGPKDFLDPFGRPAAEELEDAAKHDPKAAELMKVFRCYEEIVFDWPDEYRQMNMPVSRKGTDESLNEFASDSNDGGEDDALRNYARMWWAGDEATQMQIESALAKMGWEIGEDEGGYDNGGVFVIRAGDINGDSYTSWAAEDLTEGFARRPRPMNSFRSAQMGYTPDGPLPMADYSKYPTAVIMKAIADLNQDREKNPELIKLLTKELFKRRQQQGVAEGLPQTLRKVVPGYAKREIDKKMDAEKFGRTDVDRDANYWRYKKIQDKIKNKGVAEGAPISGDGGAVDNFKQQMANNTELAYQKGMAEAKKKKKKKSSRSLGRYFFPGYGYYGSGESGEGGGDGGGGESKNRGMAEGSEDPFGPQGRFVGDTGPAQLTTTVPRVQLQIGDRVIYKPTEQRATIVGLSRDGTQARIDMPSPMGGRTFNCKTADLKAPGQGPLREKSTSQAQFRTMAAAAHDPEFARKVGIKPSVAREFNRADKGQSYKSLPKKS